MRRSPASNTTAPPEKGVFFCGKLFHKKTAALDPSQAGKENGKESLAITGSYLLPPRLELAERAEAEQAQTGKAQHCWLRNTTQRDFG